MLTYRDNYSRAGSSKPVHHNHVTTTDNLSLRALAIFSEDNNSGSIERVSSIELETLLPYNKSDCQLAFDQEITRDRTNRASKFNFSERALQIDCAVAKKSAGPQIPNTSRVYIKHDHLLQQKLSGFRVPQQQFYASCIDG